MCVRVRACGVRACVRACVRVCFGLISGITISTSYFFTLQFPTLPKLKATWHFPRPSYCSVSHYTQFQHSFKFYLKQVCEWFILNLNKFCIFSVPFSIYHLACQSLSEIPSADHLLTIIMKLPQFSETMAKKCHFPNFPGLEKATQFSQAFKKL